MWNDNMPTQGSILDPTQFPWKFKESYGMDKILDDAGSEAKILSHEGLELWISKSDGYYYNEPFNMPVMKFNRHDDIIKLAKSNAIWQNTSDPNWKNLKANSIIPLFIFDNVRDACMVWYRTKKLTYNYSLGGNQKGGPIRDDINGVFWGKFELEPYQEEGSKKNIYIKQDGEFNDGVSLALKLNWEYEEVGEYKFIEGTLDEYELIIKGQRWCGLNKKILKLPAMENGLYQGGGYINMIAIAKSDDKKKYVILGNTNLSSIASKNIKEANKSVFDPVRGIYFPRYFEIFGWTEWADDRNTVHTNVDTVKMRIPQYGDAIVTSGELAFNQSQSGGISYNWTAKIEFVEIELTTESACYRKLR